MLIKVETGIHIIYIQTSQIASIRLIPTEPATINLCLSNREKYCIKDDGETIQDDGEQKGPFAKLMRWMRSEQPDKGGQA